MNMITSNSGHVELLRLFVKEPELTVDLKEPWLLLLVLAELELVDVIL
jgi:hypothetical protein